MMRWLGLVVVAGLAFAGCVGDASHSRPAPSSGAPPHATFGSPVLVGGGGGTEASLALGPKGDLFACEAGDAAPRNSAPFFKSLDGGATWRAPAAPTPLPQGDCDVAIGSDDTWYAAASQANQVTVASSQDQGGSWSTHVLAGPPLEGALDRPWLGTAGRELFLTHKSGNQEPFLLYFQKSADGGATWSAPLSIGGPPGAAKPNGNVGRLWVGPDGRDLLIPIHRFDATQGPGRLESFDLAVSHDAGSSWSLAAVKHDVPTRADYFLPSLARAEDGSLAFALPLVLSGHIMPSMLISKDDGATWSPPLSLGSPTDFCSAEAFIALAGGPGDRIDGAWQHCTGSSPGFVLTFARSRNGTVDFNRDLTGPEGTDAALEFLTLLIDPEGAARLLYVVPDNPCSVGGTGCVWYLPEAR